MIDINNNKTLAKEGYKQTKLGWIPEDWEIETLGNATVLLTNGFVGKAKDHYTEERDGVLYVQGYNVLENGFKLKGIKYVTKEFNKSHQKSELRKNDLLTIQTGDVGLTTIVTDEIEGANCHALIISRFKIDKYHSIYYSQYLNSYSGRGRLKSIETGSTMKHLNIKDMKKFFIPVPPLQEQQKIADILGTWDKAITAQEKLIAEKQNLKNGLMQQLLTGRKRFAGFTQEWEEVRLKNILDYEQPTKYIVETKNYSNKYNTPVLTANKSFILGYTNESYGIYDNLPIILFDDFTTDNKWVDFKFKVKSSAIKILKLKNKNFDLRFIYERMQLLQIDNTDHKRHYISEYQYLKLECPRLEEQQKISSVIMQSEKEIVSTKNHLNFLIAQKQGLMQQLLTGEKRVKI